MLFNPMHRVLCSWLSPWFFPVAEEGRAVDRRFSFGVCSCAALSVRCDSSMSMLLHSIYFTFAFTHRLHVLKPLSKRGPGAAGGFFFEGRRGAPHASPGHCGSPSQTAI